MEATRRQFVTGISATAALAAATITDSAEAFFPVLNKGVLLPLPPLPETVRESQCTWGYRPHRTGGVRLGIAPPRDTPAGKTVFHNYGHGGAGITLSLGCARSIRREVTQYVESERAAGRTPRVAIIGTGIIGLTTAHEIAKIRPRIADIRIYAKSLDLRSTVSWIAGGQFEPSGIWREYVDPNNPDRLKRLHDLVRLSGEMIKAMTSEKSRRYGIVPRKNYTLPHDAKDSAFDTGTPRDIIWRPEFGRLPFRTFVRQDGRSVVGNEYQTWLINPQILMPRLVTELNDAGVKFEVREFRTLTDVGALPENIVVNCAGLGAGALFSDPRVIPIKGQLIVLPNPGNINYFFSGGCGESVLYVFGRQSDIVIGGTYQRPIPSTGATPPPGIEINRCRSFLSVARRVFSGDISACGILSREDARPSS